jgi:hypothetical protein
LSGHVIGLERLVLLRVLLVFFLIPSAINQSCLQDNNCHLWYQSKKNYINQAN